ncbi:Ig-like domain-containing protein [Streptomyces sp. H10-C2]|uniref:L,D-transpeptidase n=1 Tax=unclassified Streptomyces TaxID=2593676 RepID=UPI0024BA5007|nr:MULTISPECIES: Ig-like domain-containing protein [unclassified Streptomyces]MDJ0340450.1 Ig-like domain-containing protein [Streptomyces sp. PH10-H1]MDJ0375212.1 Ig-like domain-containing protein [Streptomyces sp. H10-C2]
MTPDQHPRAHRRRRTGLTAVAVLLGGAITLTACGGGGSGSGGGADKPKTQADVDAAAAKDASDAKIAITPKTGTSNASITSGAKVAVTDGKLTAVTMTDVASGKAVKGAITTDGRGWKPDASLDRGKKYKVAATAQDAKGRTVTETSDFGTVSASNSFIGYFTPEDGSTVGVGMPVSIKFDKAVTNKKAVESAVKVASSSGQKIVGHWFDSTRLDFRPQEYWKAGSNVTVKLKLDGVEGSSGVYGVQNKDVNFTVGRSQVSTVDAKTKMMTVVRDGKTIKTVPISAGSADHPTYNGQMVISEKYKQTRMNGDSVGFAGEYDIPDVPHAMRLSSSGTFIHGNYWGDKSIFGSANTSHGCIGLSDAKGANDPNTLGGWFYDNSMIGDLVVMKNSPDKTIKADNGLNGWNMSWSEWTAGSALGSAPGSAL